MQMSCEDDFSDTYELAIVTDNENIESDSETDIKKIIPSNDNKLSVTNGNCQDSNNSKDHNHCPNNRKFDDSDDTCDDELIKLYDEKAKLMKEVENAFKEELLTSNRIDLELISNQSSENYEQCPICLIQFLDQEIASPNNCTHSYCLECLIEWSKNVTTCPIDRIPFEYIYARHSYEGTVYKKIEVQKKIEPDFEVADESLNTTLCQICHLGDREESLLLCDICDNGYHMECLTPALVMVPIEEWFCPQCDSNQAEQMNQSEEEFITNMLNDCASLGRSCAKNGAISILTTSDNLSQSEGSEISDLEETSTELRRYLTRTSGGRARLPVPSIPRTRAAERVRARIISNRRRKNSENDYGKDQEPGTSKLSLRPGLISVPPPAFGMDELLDALRRRRKAAAIKRKNGSSTTKVRFKKRKTRGRKLRKKGRHNKKRVWRKVKSFKRSHVESDSKGSHGFGKGKDSTKFDRRSYEENLKLKGASLSPLFTPPPSPSPPRDIATTTKSSMNPLVSHRLVKKHSPKMNHFGTALSSGKGEESIDLLGNIFADQSKMLTIRGGGRSVRVATDGSLHYSPKITKTRPTLIDDEKSSFSNLERKCLIPASTIHRPPFKHKTPREKDSSLSHPKEILRAPHATNSKVNGKDSKYGHCKKETERNKAHNTPTTHFTSFASNDDHKPDKKSADKVFKDKNKPKRPIRSAASWALEEEAELETPFKARLAATELSVSYHSICPLHIKLETKFPDPLYTKTLPNHNAKPNKTPQSKQPNKPVAPPVTISPIKIVKTIESHSLSSKQIPARSRDLGRYPDVEKSSRQARPLLPQHSRDRREGNGHHSRHQSSSSRTKESVRNFEEGRGHHSRRSSVERSRAKAKVAKSRDSTKSPVKRREEADDLEIIEVLKPLPSAPTPLCITIEEDDTGPEPKANTSNLKTPSTFSHIPDPSLANIPLPYDPFDPTPVSPTLIDIPPINSPPHTLMPLLPPPPIPCFIPPPPAFLVAAKQKEFKTALPPPPTISTASDNITTPLSQLHECPAFYQLPASNTAGHIVTNDDNSALSIPLPDFLPSCPPPPPFPVLGGPVPLPSPLSCLIPLPKAHVKTVLSLKVQSRQSGPARTAAPLFDSSDEETGEKVRLKKLRTLFSETLDAHPTVNTIAGPVGQSESKERQNSGAMATCAQLQRGTIDSELLVKLDAPVAKTEVATDLNSTIEEISRIILKAPVVETERSRGPSKREINSRDRRGREKDVSKHGRRSKDSSPTKHNDWKRKKTEERKKHAKEEQKSKSKNSTHNSHSHHKGGSSKENESKPSTSHHHQHGSKTERVVKGARGAKASEVDKKCFATISPQNPSKKMKTAHHPKRSNRKSSPGKVLASTTLLSLLGSVQKSTLPSPHNGKSEMGLESPALKASLNNGISSPKHQSTSRKEIISDRLSPALETSFHVSMNLVRTESNSLECEDHNEVQSSACYSDPGREDGSDPGSGRNMAHAANHKGEETFGEPLASDEIPNSAMDMIRREKYFQKLNHQQRVAEEVKVALKPFFSRGEITKQQYKDIMRRAVNKICGSKSGKIKPLKILSLVQAYVKLYVIKS